MVKTEIAIGDIHDKLFVMRKANAAEKNHIVQSAQYRPKIKIAPSAKSTMTNSEVEFIIYFDAPAKPKVPAASASTLTKRDQIDGVGDARTEAEIEAANGNENDTLNNSSSGNVLGAISKIGKAAGSWFSRNINNEEKETENSASESDEFMIDDSSNTNNRIDCASAN